MQTEFVTMEMENNPAWNAELEGWRPIISEWAEKGASLQRLRAREIGPHGQTARHRPGVPKSLNAFKEAKKRGLRPFPFGTGIDVCCKKYISARYSS